MNKTNRSVLSIMMCLFVTMAMCLGSVTSVFAQDEAAPEETGELLAVEEVAEEPVFEEIEPELVTFESASATDTSGATQLEDGAKFTAGNINSTKGKWHYTPVMQSGATTCTYRVVMPKKGTLALFYNTVNGTTSYYDSIESSVVTESQGTTTDDDGTKMHLYTVAAAGVINVTFSCYPSNGARDAMIFKALYAPNTVNTITAPKGKFSKVYVHGGTGTTDKASKFKIKVPAKGYILLDICDDMDTGYSVKYKTAGFKGYETLSSKNVRTRIGVKKGTYTFYVKSYAAVYDIKVKFVKVSESKYGAKKSSAALLKKGKSNKKKGVVVTNNKKVHWYKIKNSKTRKVNIRFTTKLTAGGGYGGLKVTLYDKNGNTISNKISADYKSYSIKPYTNYSTEKLGKGTYWIKVQSYDGGSGYFTIRW